MVKREPIPILMIAEKFPPHTRSGTARPMYFARHLPEFGYRPVVMAAPVLDGEPSDPDLLHLVPREIEVWRPTPLVSGRRLASMLLPGARAAPPEPRVTAADASAAPPPGANSAMRAARRGAGPRLASLRRSLDWLIYWHLDLLPPALVRGVQVGRRHDVKLVWVTAPHVRGLVLGYTLSRALRRPLIVDLRDPWTYGSLWLPGTRLIGALERAWARTILAAAARVVFASPFTQHEMEARYPVLRGKCITITNGFSADDAAIAPWRGGFEGKCLLRYCGVMNARRRPDVLLRGLSLAIERDPALRSSIHLELVGDLGGNESSLSRSGIADCVSAPGRVSRARSLALMRGADVNVLLQTIATGTDVIAGKAFDYLAARRPILGVVDANGGDAWLLRQTPGNVVVSYEREQDVADAIATLHARWRRGDLPALDGDLGAYERRHLTARLAGAFDDLLRRPAA